jgi:hypothetical protein
MQRAITLVRILSLSALTVAAVLGFAAPASAATDGYRISGPVMHENLAVYFVHGRGSTGPVPLTLQEALARRAVRVHETGQVSELAIENLGDQEVFVQSGDIVKGGQQDRVLTVSLVIPPRSGRIPIASFCVEQGRWSARGKEDVKTFGSSTASVPSREAKLAMKSTQTQNAAAAPGETRLARIDPMPGRTRTTQQGRPVDAQGAIWRSVAKTQMSLASSVAAPVAEPSSPSSLQLALENEKVAAARAAYVTALKPAGETNDDVIGYVLAINGKLNSAEIYPSNGLFRKMWSKMLEANATEAIAEKADKAEALPDADAALAFLNAPKDIAASEKPLAGKLRLQTREAPKAVFSETLRADGAFVHKSYVAK